MILFISPAKTFRESDTVTHQTPMFLNQSDQLIKKLRNLSKTEIKKQMHVSDKVANQTHTYYQTFNNDCQPAIYSYFGHQFRHLNPDDFSQQEMTYMNKHLYIMSGLYGLLKPLDMISFYRLEMQDKTITNLYDFWSLIITDYIKTHHKNDILINLASKEYGQILEPLHKTYTIEFYQIKEGKPYIHSMEAKKLRGLMAHHLLKHKISSLQALKKINIEDYTYSQALSNHKTITFTKDI